MSLSVIKFNNIDGALNIQCKHCSKNHKIKATEDQIQRYIAGQELIQHIFPEASADDRELMISKTCGKCWDKMFPPESDEE